jgi:hypothetical protein
MRILCICIRPSDDVRLREKPLENVCGKANLLAHMLERLWSWHFLKRVDLELFVVSTQAPD